LLFFDLLARTSTSLATTLLDCSSAIYVEVIFIIVFLDFRHRHLLIKENLLVNILLK
jgi:hypothetical protein